MTGTKQHGLLLAETKFGLDFLKLNLANNANQSFVFSPISISLALSLVHSGARGASRKQIEEALLGGADEKAFANHFSNLSKSLKTAENGTVVHVANRVYLGENVKFNPKYLPNISANYDASAKFLNFKNPESAEEINAFVRQATHGKIDNIVSPSSISPDTVALIVNAIYFKGKWATAFSKENTKPRNFTKSSGTVKEILFLAEWKTYQDYTCDDAFEVLVLKYEDSEYGFAIFLPKAQIRLEESLEKLDAEKLQNLLQKVERRYINIQIPKFTVENKLSLKKSLQDLGITDIFKEDEADFSGMSPENIFVSDGNHKAKIKIDEEGTIAAAATAMRMRPLSATIGPIPLNCIANRPFLFALIRENHPLFLGVFHG